MKRLSPYADASANKYASSEMQHVSAQRMQHSARMSNFPGRPDSVSMEQGHPYWQQDKVAPNVLDPTSYVEARRGSNTAQSLHLSQMVDPKDDLEKRANGDPRLQSHEQDMEIGYDDMPSQLTFEGLVQKFEGEIMNLVKEQNDAEDAENARHREKIIEINTQYLEKLSVLRAQQASRRNDFLHKESQAWLHKYHHQAGSGHQAHHLIRPSPIDPQGYTGPTAAEAPRPYGTGQYDSQGHSAPAIPETHRPYGTGQYDYQGRSVSAIPETQRPYGTGQYDTYGERAPSLAGGRSQEIEGRIPFPKGRVYNNASASYY